jgi:hypothetical protein
MVPIQPTIADDPVAVMGWRLGNRDARFGRVPWLPAIPNACTNTRFGIAICSPPVYIGGSWKGSSEIELGMLTGPQLGHTWWRSAAYGSHSSESHRRLFDRAHRAWNTSKLGHASSISSPASQRNV